MTCRPVIPLNANPQPYADTGPMRVCMDNAFWQGWFWDGETRCPKGHPSLLEIDGGADGYLWCSDDADASYGPLWWFRLEPCDPPDGSPT